MPCCCGNDTYVTDSEHDIDNLIEKTEKEGEEVEPESGTGSLFAFAKVWSADKEGMEELADEATEQSEQVDSWATALELIAARVAAGKEQEQTGRGVRRKAAAVFPQVWFAVPAVSQLCANAHDSKASIWATRR